MPLTLLEHSKLAYNNGEEKSAALIEIFARESPWLSSMVFDTIQGSAYAYNVEGALPGIAFRGINEAYTESVGVINPRVEALRICGGDLDCDLSLIQTQGPQARAKHEAMKMKALAAEVTRVLIKGDSIAQPREFDGLQARLAGNQLVSNSAAAGGAGLSLTQLDLAISRCANATAIWAPSVIAQRFSAAWRTTAISGAVMTGGTDSFGRPVMMYAGLPILVAYPDNDGTEPIDLLEVTTGGGATTTSLYVVGIGDGYLKGIQSGPMQVRDLGELDTAPVMRTRVEWLMGLVLEHPRAAVRVHNIANAAITA